MTPQLERAAYLTRRQFFSKTAGGIGAAALASLLDRDAFGAEPRRIGGGLPDLPHFAPKAKHVIYLLQNGAPPHVDLFDWKPQMEAWRGKDLPAPGLHLWFPVEEIEDRKSTRLNSSHVSISYAVFCLKKKNKI